MSQCELEQTSFIRLSHQKGCLILMAALLVFLSANRATAQEVKVVPNQTFTPQQVITIVVESLQNNASNNEGIATVFRFASPGNKAATGPLNRFTQMIRQGFPDMLNHVSVRYNPIEITGDTAVQALWLQTQSGKEQGYAFQLSKQRGGQYDGMWMTDAVVPLGQSSNSGIRI